MGPGMRPRAQAGDAMPMNQEQARQSTPCRRRRKAEAGDTHVVRPRSRFNRSPAGKDVSGNSILVVTTPEEEKSQSTEASRDSQRCDVLRLRPLGAAAPQPQPPAPAVWVRPSLCFSSDVATLIKTTHKTGPRIFQTNTIAPNYE